MSPMVHPCRECQPAQRALESSGRGPCDVSVQNPIQLTDYTEPTTRYAVCVLGGFLCTGPALPEDVLLAGKVAETPSSDRDEKIPRYAQTGFLRSAIEVEQATVTQYTQPDGTRYRRAQTLALASLSAPTSWGLFTSPSRYLW